MREAAVGFELEFVIGAKLPPKINYWVKLPAVGKIDLDKAVREILLSKHKAEMIIPNLERVAQAAAREASNANTAELDVEEEESLQQEAAQGTGYGLFDDGYVDRSLGDALAATGMPNIQAASFGPPHRNKIADWGQRRGVGSGNGLKDALIRAWRGKFNMGQSPPSAANLVDYLP